MSVVLVNGPCLMPLIFRCLMKKSDHVKPIYTPIYTSMQNDLLCLRVLSRVQKGCGYWYYVKHVSSHIRCFLPSIGLWFECTISSIILSTSWRLSCPSLSNQNDLKSHFPSRRLDVVNHTKFYIIPRNHTNNILKVSNKQHYIPSCSCYHSLHMMTMVGFVTEIESKCRLHHCCDLQLLLGANVFHLFDCLSTFRRFMFLASITQLAM